MLYLIIALWILSISGNHGDLVQGYFAWWYELAYWSLLFGAVARAAVWRLSTRV